MIVAKLRRRGMIGVFNKLSHTYWALKSRLYYAPQFASFGAGTIIRKPLFISNPGGIEIGSGTFIRDGVRLEVIDRPGDEPGRLIIGNNVDIEQNVHIVACGLVIIEDGVCITAGGGIVDATHPIGVPGDGNRAHQLVGGPASVTVERRVFLGLGSVVLPGVTIGANTIVGAGSVVSRSLPANCVAAGSPARLIRLIEAGSSDGK